MHKQGDVFLQLKAGHTLINPVNTVGVMGAGLAKQVKLNLNWACKPYFDACKRKTLRPGGVVIAEEPMMGFRVIHIATKEHFSHPSRMEWIEQGLMTLSELSHTLGYGVWHLPPIGAGLGGLNKKEVLSKIEALPWGCDLWLWNF